VERGEFMEESFLKNKSYGFALDIVRLSQFLIVSKKEFVLSKQILRSGTAIGALIREAEFGQSKADFINEVIFGELQTKCKELLAMLIATVKTAKNNL